MASSSFLIIFATAACFVPSILSTDHMVGDDEGWKPNFDYTTWAQGKEFRVGDRLVFMYQQGAHSVLRLTDEASFQQCAKPANVEALRTGNDVITLATAGKKWYVCGVATHCENGNQKLAITVLPQDGSVASSPSPGSPESPPLSAARANFASIYYGVMAFVVGFLGMLNMV